MKYSRPFICLILCLCLFCACTQMSEETQGTSPTPSPQTEPEQATQPSNTEPEALFIPEIPAQDQLISEDPKSLEEWVFTNYEQTISWRDPQKQFHTMTLVLPALTPAADFAIQYNQFVYDLGQLLIDDIRYSYERGYHPSSVSLTYETSTYDDILFIVMERRMQEGYSMLYVDAFDLEDRRALYVGDVSEALVDMDYPTFILAVTELVKQEYIRAYEPMIKELEESQNAGSFSPTEPNSTVTEYYDTLERFPYLTLYLSQSRLFMDSEGNLLLSVCTPSTQGIKSIRRVIPFDISALGWDSFPTEEQAYGHLLDIQHYVDGIHADACSIMLTEAFFSDPEEFVEHAAVESSDSIDFIIGLLKYNLYGDQIAEFIRECNGLLRDDDLTEKERTFVNSALDAIK